MESGEAVELTLKFMGDVILQAEQLTKKYGRRVIGTSFNDGRQAIFSDS